MVKIRNWLAGSYHYVKGLGVLDGLLFSWADIWKIRKLREVTIGGQRLFLRTHSTDFRVAEMILLHGEFRHIAAVAPKVIFDIGANIGAAAVFFAIAYPNATIYAFEPEKDNFALLEKNCANISNIVPIKKAIWNSQMMREIINRKTGEWGYTILPAEEETSGIGQVVECTTIKDFMDQAGLEKIDILKIDIEGCEREVFLNSGEWIDRVEIIIVELHDRICAGCTTAFESATRGFEKKRINGEKVVASRKPST